MKAKLFILLVILSFSATAIARSGIIKPYYGGYSDAWEFDGKYLKPYYGGYSDGWEWDGKYLKPYNGFYSDGWEWDGKYLRPYNGFYSDGWEWDGKYLKPYNGFYSDGWEFDGKYFKPYLGGFDNAWEIEGDVPIPVIAAAIGILGNGQPPSTSGTCGAGLWWELTGSGSNLTLTITGTGRMTSYTSYNPAPWQYYKGSITTAVIGSGVTFLSYEAFTDCYRLTAFDVDANNNVYSSENGILFNEDKTILYRCPEGKSGSYTIPNTVTTLNGGAFAYCSKLTEVVIPNSVTAISDAAFGFCTRIEEIIIPNSVTSIGNGAFYYCIGLTKVTIPGSVTFVDMSAFKYCSGLTELTIPNSVTTMGWNAFACQNLTDIYVSWNNPPAISTEYDVWDVFYTVPKSKVRLHIPSGTKSIYKKSPVWQDFLLVEDGLTGMEETHTDALKLYPNPVKEVLIIENGELTIENAGIYDLSGKIIIDCQLSTTNSINVSALPQGIYFVKLETNKGIIKKKFIKK